MWQPWEGGWISHQQGQRGKRRGHCGARTRGAQESLLPTLPSLGQPAQGSPTPPNLATFNWGTTERCPKIIKPKPTNCTSLDWWPWTYRTLRTRAGKMNGQLDLAGSLCPRQPTYIRSLFGQPQPMSILPGTWVGPEERGALRWDCPPGRDDPGAIAKWASWGVCKGW